MAYEREPMTNRFMESGECPQIQECGGRYRIIASSSDQQCDRSSARAAADARIGWVET